MQFADGASATAVYNGYGYFSTMELIDDVTEWGFTEPIDKRPPVRRAAGSAADELAAKRRRAADAIPASAPHQPHFGLTLVSCERGDIRQSPDGLFVYSDKGREEIALSNDRSPRDLVLEAVAEAQGLKATESDLDARIARMAEARGVPVGEVYGQLQKANRLPELERAIREEKVFEYLLSQSTVEEVKS